jgi:hypothetical protein
MFKAEKRKCDGCTRCCEGWLHATITGPTGEAYPMYPGRKCQFHRKGSCSIYDRRPADPCRGYTCAWLTEEIIPEWMKPSESNVILTWHKVKEIDQMYLEVVECGTPLTAEVLNWLIHLYLRNKVNVVYRLSGGTNHIGTREFMQWAERVRVTLPIFPFWKHEEPAAPAPVPAEGAQP